MIRLVLVKTFTIQTFSFFECNYASSLFSIRHTRLKWTGRSRRNYNLLVVTLVSVIVQPCWSLLREQSDCHIWNLHDFLTKFTNFHQSKTRCFIHENDNNCIYITSSISSKQPPISGIWSCSVISTVSSNVPRKRKLNECTSNILLNITSISYNISS